MSYSISALIMLTAGLGIPVLASLNATLGQFIGSPVAAVTILLFVAFFTICLILVFTSNFPVGRIAEAPRHLFLAGLLVVFYMLSVTAIAPQFGVGNAIFFVLLGQLISAALVDHFALFGSTGSPLTLTRTLGLGLMGLGVWMTQQA
ncbi:MAG: DMT family transporter [Paracoccaceae bacterium]|nr:DMT family transporter [Paracoccaceae bacterium]